MTEAQLSAKIVALLNAMERTVAFKHAAGPRRGIEDIICCHMGSYVAIESKLEKGELTALQEKRLQDIGKCGGIPIVVVGREGLKQFQALLHEAQQKGSDLWLTQSVRSCWKDFVLQPIWLGKKIRLESSKAQLREIDAKIIAEMEDTGLTSIQDAGGPER